MKKTKSKLDNENLSSGNLSINNVVLDSQKKKLIYPNSNLIDNLLIAKEAELMNKLHIGDWSEKDESDLRALAIECGKRNIGPWERHRVYSAISEDGYTYEKENLLILDRASVPEVVMMPDGKVKLFYVEFNVDDIIAREGIAGSAGIGMAVSDNGINFKKDKRFRIIGLETSKAVDPSVVLLPDGSLRLFWIGASHGFSNRQPLEVVHIYSAISFDGLIFWCEPGVRLLHPPGLDPAVLRINDNIWRIWMNGLYTATSKDGGSSFNVDSNIIRLEGHKCSLSKFRNGYRIYYCIGEIGESIEIKSSFSKDGSNWKKENGIRLKGKDIHNPSVVSLPDGRYRMYYGSGSREP